MEIKRDTWARLQGRKVAHYVAYIRRGEVEAMMDCGKAYPVSRLESVTVNEDNTVDVPTCKTCDAHFVGRSHG